MRKGDDGGANLVSKEIQQGSEDAHASNTTARNSGIAGNSGTPAKIVEKKHGGANKGKAPDKNLKCTHCKLGGHTEPHCWFAHPEKAPAYWKEGPKQAPRARANVAAVRGREEENIHDVYDTDPTLALMTRQVEKGESSHSKPEELPKKSDAEIKREREELFHLNIQVKKGVVQAIIDPGSQKNLISEDLIKKMGLDVRSVTSGFCFACTGMCACLLVFEPRILAKAFGLVMGLSQVCLA